MIIGWITGLKIQMKLNFVKNKSVYVLKSQLNK